MSEVAGVGVDSRDRVYVFNRGNMPMLVFDRDGNMIDNWGNETPWGDQEEVTDPYGQKRVIWQGVRFGWPHSVRVDPEGNLWLVDVLTGDGDEEDVSHWGSFRVRPNLYVE